MYVAPRVVCLVKSCFLLSQVLVADGAHDVHDDAKKYLISLVKCCNVYLVALCADSKEETYVFSAFRIESDTFSYGLLYFPVY
jgi:hypothetical protein